MTVENLIRYLRLSVNVQDSEITEQDPEYLSMSDEDLLLYLNICLTRNFPDIPDLKHISNDAVFGLILLAKKELFTTLAVKDAPLIDITADNNNSLRRSQRFDHYMKLAEQADKEYKDWLEDGGGEDAIGTLKSYNVLLSDRYGTRYNYENARVPKVLLYLGDVAETTAEFDWSVKNIGRFHSYKVYVSTSPILDLYSDTKDKVISSDAKLVATYEDIHKCGCRLTNLTPNTEYYVVVEANNLTGLSGYAQESFTTLESGD